MLSPIRRLLKKFHPEGIPWPGTVIYNTLSAIDIFQRHYELIANDILNYCREGRILDIGTGPGRLLEKLHRASPGLQLTGLDISPAMVIKARENMKKAGLSDFIQISAGDAANLPFADDSFDAVISTGAVHHWKDPASGLNEVYRVLKPGGYALIYDLVSDTPKSVMEETAREFGKLKVFLLWLHAFEEPFYSYRDFHLLARPTPFRDYRVRFVGVMFCLILPKQRTG